ncbi:E3 ubiquitin-protein ligase Midline-1-like [Mytilus edulis]|uniref:E3 ubiquitin-protein ligase Midline-1-like n=1 Tax=Mytilus edulis TaxID=6550 RepID=UPI0039EE8EB6
MGTAITKKSASNLDLHLTKDNKGFRMTSEKNIQCGPCLFDDVTKDAGKWCTNCEEGICDDCENVHRKSKTSRNHKVISIEDYRKIENVSISQVCEHHGENLEWFCKSHDEVLCVVCVPSKHKACTAVIPISVNSANSRQSTALSDLEESIDGTLSNLKQCIKNRESAPNEIENQEIAVKTMILETRMNINHHLDRLQEECLQELRSTTQTCISKYMEIV